MAENNINTLDNDATSSKKNPNETIISFLMGVKEGQECETLVQFIRPNSQKLLDALNHAKADLEFIVKCQNPELMVNVFGSTSIGVALQSKCIYFS